MGIVFSGLLICFKPQITNLRIITCIATLLIETLRPNTVLMGNDILRDSENISKKLFNFITRDKYRC